MPAFFAYRFVLHLTDDLRTRLWRALLRKRTLASSSMEAAAVLALRAGCPRQPGMSNGMLGFLATALALAALMFLIAVRPEPESLGSPSPSGAARDAHGPSGRCGAVDRPDGHRVTGARPSNTVLVHNLRCSSFSTGAGEQLPLPGHRPKAATMTTSPTEKLLGILQAHFNPREEGWLWLALYADDRDSGVVNQIEGDYEEPRATAHALGRVINELSPVRAYLALCRHEGRPREADRELWREIRRLVAGDRLLDMVVFNQRQAWSMRAEDAAAA